MARKDTDTPVEQKEEVSKKSTARKKKTEKKDKNLEKIASLEAELAELKDKNLRLFAEFDNFRKRTAKERIEYRSNATADMIGDLLTVLDDFERAEKAMLDSTDIDAVKKGLELVHTKLLNLLTQKGLKSIDVIDQVFDPEVHEAITEIPAPSEDMKGKIIDQVEKGYTLNDKLIRFPKVVVAK